MSPSQDGMGSCSIPYYAELELYNSTLRLSLDQCPSYQEYLIQTINTALCTKINITAQTPDPHTHLPRPSANSRAAAGGLNKTSNTSTSVRSLVHTTDGPLTAQTFTFIIGIVAAAMACILVGALGRMHMQMHTGSGHFMYGKSDPSSDTAAMVAVADDYSRTHMNDLTPPMSGLAVYPPAPASGVGGVTGRISSVWTKAHDEPVQYIGHTQHNPAYDITQASYTQQEHDQYYHQHAHESQKQHTIQQQHHRTLDQQDQQHHAQQQHGKVVSTYSPHQYDQHARTHILWKDGAMVEDMHNPRHADTHSHVGVTDASFVPMPSPRRPSYNSSIDRTNIAPYINHEVVVAPKSLPLDRYQHEHQHPHQHPHPHQQQMHYTTSISAHAPPSGHMEQQHHQHQQQMHYTTPSSSHMTQKSYAGPATDPHPQLYPQHQRLVEPQHQRLVEPAEPGAHLGGSQFYHVDGMRYADRAEPQYRRCSGGGGKAETRLDYLEVADVNPTSADSAAELHRLLFEEGGLMTTDGILQDPLVNVLSLKDATKLPAAPPYANAAVNGSMGNEYDEYSEEQEDDENEDDAYSEAKGESNEDGEGYSDTLMSALELPSPDKPANLAVARTVRAPPPPPPRTPHIYGYARVSPLLVPRLDARVCGGSCFRGHRGMTGRNFVRCWLRSFKGMMHGTASRTNVVYTSAFCA